MKHHTPMAHRHQRPAGFLLGGRPDLADWRKALDRLDGSYSPHTLLSYRSDFESFEAWCKNRDFKYLPAAPSTVAAYITAETNRLKPSTLKRKLAGIRKIHYLLRLRDPTYDVDVDLAMRRARRLKPQRPSQALGVTAVLRDRLLAATTDDLSGLRDRALVSVVSILSVVEANSWLCTLRTSNRITSARRACSSAAPRTTRRVQGVSRI